MIYQKISPTPSLAPFVECIYWWENNCEGPIEVQSPPNGYNALVFNYGKPYMAGQVDCELKTVPSTFISGQLTSNYKLQIQEFIGVVGIVFKPTGVYNLFRLTMSNLVNERVDASLLLGEVVNELSLQIISAVDYKERISILFDYLAGKLAGAEKRNEVDDAIDYIDAGNGAVSVFEVAEKLGVNKRTLEKKFLIKVGISPKLYARIKRFAILSNKVAHSEKIDWLDMVSEGGFHDQSHLVKEYLEFNKMSPAVYHKTHQELVRFLKKT
jgi:AraC-like DNA-binding protein